MEYIILFVKVFQPFTIKNDVQTFVLRKRNLCEWSSKYNLIRYNKIYTYYIVMLCFNILYTNYKDQHIYKRFIKCEIDHEDTSYNIKYSNSSLGLNLNKSSRHSVEKSFLIEKSIIEYTNDSNDSHYKVHLVPTNDTNMNVYCNSPEKMTKSDTKKMNSVMNYLSTILFIDVPKKDNFIPEDIKILVDYERLDELIEKYDYEILDSRVININIYDKQGVLHMIRKYEREHKNKKCE